MRKHLLFCLLFLAGTVTAIAQTMMPQPPQTGTYSGGTRGYWFTAPTCFTINALRVPTDASTAAQNVVVVRLPAPPPFYATVTNTFTTLAIFQNVNTTTPIPVNIPVQSGDIIGIMGTRGTVCSYGVNPFSTTIGGFPVTLARMGYQANLSAIAPYDLWQENGGSIARVEMYYTVGVTSNLTTNIVGNTVTFNLTTDTSATVVWDFGDGNSSTQTSPTHTYAGGNYTACVYISATCGNDTICVPLNLCAAPTAGFTTSNSGLTTSFANGTTGAATYSWSFGDGTTDTSATPQPHTYATSGTYNVCLIATSACGASDTICNTVTACVTPTAGFTLNLMGRDTASFTDNSIQGSNFSWSFGDGTTSTQQNPTHIYAASGTYTVCLITDNICGSDTTCQTVTICLNAPVSNWTQSVNLLNAQFTDASQFATGWNWSFGNGATSNQQSPAYTFTQNGNFLVCLTVSNDCGETDSSCQVVSVCAPPIAAFTYNASLGQITFLDGSTLASNWSWTFGDGAISTAQSPIHTYSVGGMYQVCMVVTNVCGSDSLCDSVNVVLVGMEEGLEGMNVEVYPNPTSQIATVMVSGGNLQDYQLELFNLAGARVRTANGRAGQPLTLDVNELSDGMYLYRILVDGQPAYTGKLTVSE